MPDFDRHARSYRDEVEHAIGFARQDLGFFTAAKAAEILRLVERRIGDPSALTALDVGCGSGETDRELVGSFARLYGVDTSPEMIEAAAAANPTVQYQFYDGTTLPFDDETFELAFAVSVLHHVPPPSWSGLVRELRRVTKPHGLVVVIEHNPYNPMTRLAVFRCAFDHDATLLRLAEVEQLFDQNELDISDSRYIMFFPWRGRRLRSLESRLWRFPLGAQYVVGGRPRPLGEE